MTDLGINLDEGTFLGGGAAQEGDLISRGPHLGEEEADLEANIVIVARTGPHHVPSSSLSGHLARRLKSNLPVLKWWTSISV
jgi:hypothetical protein